MTAPKKKKQRTNYIRKETVGTVLRFDNGASSGGEGDGEQKGLDPEATLVTKLMAELKACVNDADEELKAAGVAAEEVTKAARSKDSYPKLKRVLSKAPPPLEESEG